MTIGATLSPVIAGMVSASIGVGDEVAPFERIDNGGFADAGAPWSGFGANVVLSGGSVTIDSFEVELSQALSDPIPSGLPFSLEFDLTDIITTPGGAFIVEGHNGGAVVQQLGSAIASDAYSLTGVTDGIIDEVVIRIASQVAYATFDNVSLIA